MQPIAAYQFTLNVPSSAGAQVNFVALQSADDKWCVSRLMSALLLKRRDCCAAAK
jgi:hypothetical protein